MTQFEFLAVLATILAGVVRTSVGVGAGMALTASLSLMFDPRMTLAVMAFLQIGFGISALFHYWNRWDTRIAVRLTGWMFLGVVAGTWLINVVPMDWARRLLGAGLAIVAAIEVSRRENLVKLLRAAVPQPVVPGFLSGVAGSTANACGAVAAMYLKRHPLSHDAFLSTLSVVVMSHDLFRLGVFWQFGMLSGGALNVALLLLPFAFIGGWIGTKVRAAINERSLSRWVLGLVIIVGVMLLR
jgi:uncharacterized membrane protein YfcA